DPSPSEGRACCYRITNPEEVMAPHQTKITEQKRKFNPEKREQVVWNKGLLYQLWVPKSHAQTWKSHHQVIVPCKYRQRLLSMAHNLPCAGHMGRERTRQQLQANFYWPRIAQTVTNYCRSCEICQRKGKMGIDIVGPLRHKTPLTEATKPAKFQEDWCTGLGGTAHQAVDKQNSCHG
uniref:Gypsy retrotransposon integrase-like protein 1 n=1 Tax=Crocodylus porosus TaxID=8502 RepID=A0A7M4FNF8_CROPO